MAMLSVNVMHILCIIFSIGLENFRTMATNDEIYKHMEDMEGNKKIGINLCTHVIKIDVIKIVYM